MIIVLQNATILSQNAQKKWTIIRMWSRWTGVRAGMPQRAALRRDGRVEGDH
jgi:hypothetical protein